MRPSGEPRRRPEPQRLPRAPPSVGVASVAPWGHRQGQRLSYAPPSVGAAGVAPWDHRGKRVGGHRPQQLPYAPPSIGVAAVALWGRRGGARRMPKSQQLPQAPPSVGVVSVARLHGVVGEAHRRPRLQRLPRAPHPVGVASVALLRGIIRGGASEAETATAPALRVALSRRGRRGTLGFSAETRRKPTPQLSGDAPLWPDEAMRFDFRTQLAQSSATRWRHAFP